jgi:hypothetical protein
MRANRSREKCGSDPIAEKRHFCLDRRSGQESKFGSILLKEEICVPYRSVRRVNSKNVTQGWAMTGFVPNVQTES